MANLRKIVGLGIIGVMVLGLVACGKSEPTASAIESESVVSDYSVEEESYTEDYSDDYSYDYSDDSSDDSSYSSSGSSSDSSSDYEYESESYEDEYVEEEPAVEEDPLAMFEVSEETFWETEGEFFLKRDGKMYWFHPYFNPNIGFSFYYTFEKFSYGDVPILTFYRDDVIMCQSSSSVPSLHLDAKEYNFTSFCYSEDENCLYTGTGGNLLYGDRNCERIKIPNGKFTITDMNGMEMESYENLNYGERYIVSWNEGTHSKQIEVVADSRYYSIDQNRQDYIISGDLTDEGYATYDLSGVEPGLYSCCMMIIEIK